MAAGVVVAAAAEAAWAGQEAAVVMGHQCSEAPTCQAPHNVPRRARCWNRRGTASINSGERAAARRIKRSRRGASNKNVVAETSSSAGEQAETRENEGGRREKERKREKESNG